MSALAELQTFAVVALIDRNWSGTEFGEHDIESK